MKLLHSFVVVFDIWYNRHAETDKSIISNVHPSTGIRVLPDSEWFAKDFQDQAVEIDLEKSFFDQYYKLNRAVPRAAGYHYVPPVRSLSFISLGDEDSYFVLGSQSKRCFSSTNIYDTEDSVECARLRGGQLCCNVIRSDRMYRCFFTRESFDCTDSSFIFDCRNCSFCFGAVNQRNKKYLWFNEQLNQVEWEKRRSEVDLSSWQTRQEYENKFHDFVVMAVWPENFNVNEKDSSGEYLQDCRGIRNGYYIESSGSSDLENVSFVLGRAPSQDIYGGFAIIASSDCYQVLGVNNASQIKFALSIISDSFDCEYCETCYNCEHCFGCVGLKYKKFCILNKQYSEDEYWKILDELKCVMLERGEYGDLPLANFSTQVCQSSGLGVIYGASDAECRLFGAKEIKPADDGAEGAVLEPTLIRPVSEIPDRIEDKEKIAGTVWRDEKMNRRFSYLLPELEMYDQLKIAPPRKHPTRRITDLYREMNMPIFFETECQKCQKKISTAKNQAYPDRKIYCHACYLKYLEENN